MDRSIVVAITLAALITVSGCSNASNPSTESQINNTPIKLSPTSDFTGAKRTAVPSPQSQTETPTSTPPPTPQPNNPWKKENLTVVMSSIKGPRDYEPPTLDGIEYWSANRIERYTNYSLQLNYSNSAHFDESDIIIKIVEEIDQCGYGPVTSDIRGCSPLIEEDDRLSQPIVIEIMADSTDLETSNTVKHELGHVLGINHGEDPLWLMASIDYPASGFETDASNRDDPWNTSSDIKVAVMKGTENYSKVREGVSKAVEYYNERRTYLPPGKKLVLVDRWYEAHIIIRDGKTDISEGSTTGSYSEPVIYGLNYDEDRDLEKWEVAFIELNDIPPENVEYHAGHWIGYLAGDNDHEIPPKYRR